MGAPQNFVLRAPQGLNPALLSTIHYKAFTN